MKVSQNPYLIFSPFLLLYVIYILIFQKEILFGDEFRFLSYSDNLLHGYYSPPDTTLGQGPGYSIFLVPFLALDLPFLCIKLMNALFLYLSIIFLFKALRLIVSFKLALIVSLFWACYFNSFEFMHLMYSEVFSTLLVSLLLFFIVKSFHPSLGTTDKKKHLILSGFMLGYITLTKVIFGYVMLVFLIALFFLWIINRSAVNYRKSLLILLVAFITVAPYLIYTYKLTGKVYYWSTYGGETLYWMSTGYEGQYGSWFAVPNLVTNFMNSEDSLKKVHESGYLNIHNMHSLIPGVEDSLRLRHQGDFDEILSYSTSGVERDNAFNRIAIRNIKANPINYVKNCLSNIGRILFNFPYSYAKQKPSTLLRLPLNGIIMVFMLFCLIPTLLNWKRIIYPIRFLLFFVLVYLGGSVLGTAEIRMFSIIVPLLLFWIAYTLSKTVKIDFKFN